MIKHGANMKKKASLDYVLLVSIISIVVLLVILRIDIFIFDIIKGKDENLACVISASLQSMTKKFSQVGIALGKLHCPRQHVTIVMKEKEAKDKEEKNKQEKYYFIDSPIHRDRLKLVQKWDTEYREKLAKLQSDALDKDVPIISSDFKSPEGKKRLYEYRMNEIIANQMKSCWNMLGRGELDLFTDLKSPIKLKESPFEFELKDIGSALIGAGVFTVAGAGPVGIIGGALAADIIANSQLDIKIKRNRCVVCSRVIFEDKVKNEFGSKVIKSLPRWTQTHPVKIISKRPISYYEFLLDESIPTDFSQISQDERYYYSTNKPYVVVFKRMSLTAPIGSLKKAFNKVTDIGNDREEASIDLITLYPYEEIYKYCPEVEN